MKNHYALIAAALLCLLPQLGNAQAVVTVTAVPGEDTDSSPRDENNRIIGPETDNVFETVNKAVDFLMQHSNGGRLIVNTVAPAFGNGIVTKPLEVVGVSGANAISDGFNVTGAKLTVTNVQFKTGAVYANANSEIVVKNSIFDGSLNGILTSGESVKLDVQDTEFKNIIGKGIVVFAETAAESLVKNCTFTECYIGVDDAHRAGTSRYENLVFSNIYWIGINIEPRLFLPDDTTTNSIIQDCYFEGVGFQGIHCHGAYNVRISRCVVLNSGVLSAFGGDGAGIGGHEYGSNITIEESYSVLNVGAGIFFEGNIKDLSIRNNIIQENGNSGIRITNCENVNFAGGLVTQNTTSDPDLPGGGIALIDVRHASLSNMEISFNRTDLAGLGGGGGIYASNSDATFTECLLNYNQAGWLGGAIYLVNSPLDTHYEISSCLVTDNESFQSGGGVAANVATIQVDNGNFEGNISHGSGGAFAIIGTPIDDYCTIDNATLEENDALDDGGGIYTEQAIVHITGNTIRFNTADRDGGGVAMFSAPEKTTDGILTEIRKNTIESNEAGRDGGGIFVKDCSPDVFIGGIPGTALTQLIHANDADRHGGGLYVSNSNIAIGIERKGVGGIEAPNSIKDNETREGNGGGIFVTDIGANGQPQMVVAGGNVIQSNMAAGNNAPDDPAVARIGNGGGIAVEKSENVFLGGDVIGALENEEGGGNTAENNGGGLYCFEAVLTIGASTGQFSNETIRGNRAQKGNGGGAAIVRSSHAPGTAKFTIANAYVQYNAADGAPTPDKSVHLSTVGNGGGVAIVDESNNVQFGDRRAFGGEVGTGIQAPRFRLNDGNVCTANGGGIYIKDSNPSLETVHVIGNISFEGCGGGIAVVGADRTVEAGHFRSCIIQSNIAFSDPPAGVERIDALVGNGGGMAFLEKADGMDVENCTIGRTLPNRDGDLDNRGNLAVNNGGGIYAHDSNPWIVVNKEITEATTTIRENQSRNGGGMAIRGHSDVAFDPLVIERVEIHNNLAAEGHGGGIAMLDEANDVAIDEAVIDENNAAEMGGGIYIRNSNPVLGNELGTGAFPFHGGKVLIQKNHAHDKDGGGIACDGDSNTLGSDVPLLIRGVVVLGNQADKGNGGGIAFINACSNVSVNFNLIGLDSRGNAVGNMAPNGNGGGIYVNGSEPVIGGQRVLAAVPLIQFPGLPQNVIFANKAKNGGGVAFANGASSAFFGNAVGSSDQPSWANEATEKGGGIYSDGGAPLIGPITPPPTAFSMFLTGGNSIIGNVAMIGGGCAFEKGSIGELRWNLITENRVKGPVGSTGGVYISGNGTTPTITNNTIVLNQDDGLRAVNGANPVVQNVIFDSNTGFGATGAGFLRPIDGGTFASNDLFGNGVAAYGPGTPILTNSINSNLANIELDPLFQDRILKDYRLTTKSPCTPGNSPPGSLLIGALPGPVVQQPTQNLVLASYRDADYGDINGDGWPDLAVATSSTDFVLLNAGAGVFAGSREIFIPSSGLDNSHAIELGDVDGDGDLDVVVANDGRDTLALNQGDRFENASDRIPSTGISNNVKIADLDGNGSLEILFARNGMNALYRNDGHGNFIDASADLNDGQDDSRDIGIGDLDADGDLDLYIANAELDSVLLNNGQGVFTLGVRPPVNHAANRVALGDADSDGDLDVYLADDAGGTLLYNRGDATFEMAVGQLPTNLGEIMDGEFADADNDGDVDIQLVTVKQSGVLFNGNLGNFITTLGRGLSILDNYWEIDAADVDGDGGLESVAIKETGIEHYDGFIAGLPNRKPIVGVAPYRTPAGRLVTITGNDFKPSVRHVTVVFDGQIYPGYLVNISQVSFAVPPATPEGDYPIEITSGTTSLGKATIHVGDLVVTIEDWIDR